MAVPDELLLAESGAPASRSPHQLALRLLLRDRLAVLSVVLLLGLVATSLLAPWMAPADAVAAGPWPAGTPGHPLGTDAEGRDLLGLLLHGGRLSLLLATLPVLVAWAIGTAVGLFAGYRGGLLKQLVLIATDVCCAFPPALLALVLAGVLGGGGPGILMALTLVFVPQVTREATRVTTQVVRRDHVAAARLSGDSAWGVVRHHVLRAVLVDGMAHAASLLGTSLVLACGLGFLGLGVQPPQAEWGLVLQAVPPALASQPLLLVLPVALIVLAALAFDRLARGLHAALHPQR